MHAISIRVQRFSSYPEGTHPLCLIRRLRRHRCPFRCYRITSHRPYPAFLFYPEGTHPLCLEHCHRRHRYPCCYQYHQRPYPAFPFYPEGTHPRCPIHCHRRHRCPHCYQCHHRPYLTSPSHRGERIFTVRNTISVIIRIQCIRNTISIGIQRIYRNDHISK